MGFYGDLMVISRDFMAFLQDRWGFFWGFLEILLGISRDLSCFFLNWDMN